MKPIVTLVLLADDAAARILINEGIGKGLREHAVLSLTQFADAQVGYDDRPGRQTGSPAGAHRHGLDPHETADALSRARFARHLAEALDQEWAQLRPDRLIIAASPKMLGVLRDSIKGAPAAALHADLAKDLMQVTLRDLPGHFADIQPM